MTNNVEQYKALFYIFLWLFWIHASSNINLFQNLFSLDTDPSLYYMTCNYFLLIYVLCMWFLKSKNQNIDFGEIQLAILLFF